MAWTRGNWYHAKKAQDELARLREAQQAFRAGLMEQTTSQAVEALKQRLAAKYNVPKEVF